MIDITKYIDPRNWLWWALGAGAVVAGLWFGVISPYNNYVTKKAVTVALAHERAEVKPKIAGLELQVKELTRRVAERDATISEYKAQSEVLAEKIKTNQGVLNATLKKLDKSTTELATLRGSDADFKRLLDAATANTGSSAGTSAVTRLGQLTSAHYQCQEGFREERNRHAKTIAGLEQALAVIDALQIK